MTFRAWTLLVLFLSPAGCSDDSGEVDPDAAATTGLGGTTGMPDGAGSEASTFESSGDAATAESTIRGTFVWVDGSEETLEFDAAYELLELSSSSRHSCGGDGDGYSLGVSWVEGSQPGTYDLQDLSGPQLLVAWPTEDGSIRATYGTQGELTFTRLSDEVEGTASVTFSPDPSDPNDRAQTLKDVAFRCSLEG